MVDPLTLTGVFMLGASAGAVLTHVRSRSLPNNYEELSGHEYDNRVFSGTVGSEGQRHSSAVHLGVQPMFIAHKKHHPGSERSQKVTNCKRMLTVLNENKTYGDERLAQ